MGRDYRGGIDPVLARAADEVLRRPPRVPSDPDLFTSNTLFGEPGIYPLGAPMAPAPGPGWDARAGRRDLEALVGRERLALVDEPRLVDALPDAGLRVAVVALGATVGAPVLEGFPTDTTAARLAFGRPASAGRVIGPADDATVRVVNERYRHEHPLLLCGSLVHDLLWTPETSGHAAEVILHALLAMTHVQVLARLPALARLGTELARRQNSLAITLLNSRPPGALRSSLVAPDGPGTIPGGAPDLQTPDFWSIPFGPEQERAAPPLLGAVLDQLVDPSAARPTPLRFGRPLAEWIDEHLRSDWLPLADHVRVAVALGLVDAAELADAAAVSHATVCEAFAIDRPATPRI